MDIKDLNRSQFLLLILLIMLVTSISTATVTVTLMDQSPKAGVVNTINQVIERVIPGATTTVIQLVKEEKNPADQGEQIIKAMEKVAPLVVRIERKTDKGTEYLGSGLVVGGGLAVTTIRNIPADNKFVTLVQGGLSTMAEVIKLDQANSVAFLKFTSPVGLASSSPVFAETAPASGQTSIVLSLADNNNIEITTGLVMGVISASSVIASTSPTTAEVIRTGAVNNDNLGGPLINLKGEIVGMGISRGYALAGPALKLLIDQIR